MERSLIKSFRAIALLEGISYLFLLGVAMPLKYYADIPSAVKYTGWAHGILFMLFIILTIQVKFKLRWTYGWAFWSFICSLLPFGTFILDWQIKKKLEHSEPSDAVA